MSVVKSVRSRKFIAALTALGAVAAMLLGTRVAVADSVWVQSYQRGSASEACVAQAGETPWQDSWGPNPGWSPSWEQWANAGKGGWTCTRSITWAQTPAPAASSSGGSGGSVTYRVGDVGPGGGLVFYDAGSVQAWGRYLEMAPKAWSGEGTPDVSKRYCDTIPHDIPGAAGTAVGTGAANTAAMAASIACSSDAAAAVLAYAPAGTSAGQWFLPSKAELNEMYTYSRVIDFNAVTYGFVSPVYWSSSQFSTLGAWYQNLSRDDWGNNFMSNPLGVRPVRAF